MGRKKKRRGRDRLPLGAETQAGVETAEFEMDEAPTEASPSRPPAKAGGAAAPALESPSAPGAVDPGRNVQTLGELLQQAREARGLTIDEASARTRISSGMLRHLESDRFGEFSADAYVKGFLRNYGNFLGLDVGLLLRRYEAISGRLVEREPDLLEVETTPRRPTRRASSRSWTIIAAVAALGVLLWLFWNHGAARVGLRPTPGLEQIENELRQPQQPSPQPAPPEAKSTVDLPGVESAPLPSTPVPPPAPESLAPASPAPPAPPAAKAAKPTRRPAKKVEKKKTQIEDLVPPGPW